ncbi:hypothetical protein FNE59_08200 [Bacillus thuringiensis]|uniref:Uncharacterized protein n=1 Tax=Bacillus thuringiensis TaxID=1428 RepID=A0A9X7AIW1_BACTU|nr:hypothetical protein [Bacillus thuringiensis]PFT38716.1 hypothetical protein COK72_25265 [Bacillus thuringiensis]
MNYLTFFLHARNISENTVYSSLSNDSFGRYSKESFFICTSLYRTRFRYFFAIYYVFFTKHV